ncbi:hypothetical protein [Bacteroides fragilis]|uniref:hypothetical protein n=1 Tax=Bacteroides fragilis TaxID=817 RepID=UPI0005168607|nr:hypothetical protein [Bacteroides fragilis]
MMNHKETNQKLSTKFKKAVMMRSVSKVWEQAVLEWEFDKYCYNDTELKIYCPCSPREIKHITVIKNKRTNKFLEIDNKCAETYFGITESEKIKESVQRLSRNINLGMNRAALDYLWKNRCIHEIDYNNYEIVQGKRDSKHLYSEKMIQIRQKINKVLINYTKYEYASFFIWIDYAIATSEEHPDFNVSSAISNRQNVLVNGKPDNYKFDKLWSTIEKYYKYYPDEKRNKIMDEYLGKGLNEDLKKCLKFSEFYDRITHLTPLTGDSRMSWEQNKTEIARRKKKRQTKKDNNKMDYSHLAEGLEDWTDSYHYTYVDQTEDLEAKEEFWNRQNGYMEEIRRNKADYYFHMNYDTEEWDECNFEDDDLASRNDATLMTFFDILYDWVVLEMEARGIESKECSKNMGYSLKEVVHFINIPRMILFHTKKESSSFYQVMACVPVKYSYQLLDWLIRNSDENVKLNMLGKLKNFLNCVKLSLIHNERITRIKSLI